MVPKSYKDDKITKTASQIAPETTSQSDENLLEIPKERYISPQKMQQIINELRLI